MTDEFHPLKTGPEVDTAHNIRDILDNSGLDQKDKVEVIHETAQECGVDLKNLNKKGLLSTKKFYTPEVQEKHHEKKWWVEAGIIFKDEEEALKKLRNIDFYKKYINQDLFLKPFRIKEISI